MNGWMSKGGESVAWNKYHAKTCWIDGILFHSRAEARYYCELKLKRRAGLIRDFRRQVAFDLRGLDGRVAGRHKVDFLVEYAGGRQEAHEVKGFATADWKMRRALFMQTHPDIPYRTFREARQGVFVEIMKG